MTCRIVRIMILHMVIRIIYLDFKNGIQCGRTISFLIIWVPHSTMDNSYLKFRIEYQRIRHNKGIEPITTKLKNTATQLHLKESCCLEWRSVHIFTKDTACKKSDLFLKNKKFVI